MTLQLLLIALTAAFSLNCGAEIEYNNSSKTPADDSDPANRLPGDEQNSGEKPSDIAPNNNVSVLKPRTSAQIFFSGHSLLDSVANENSGYIQPIIDTHPDITGVAKMQSEGGSTIAYRASLIEGNGFPADWGKRNFTAYDTMVVTEFYEFAKAAVNDNTIQNLAKYYTWMIEDNTTKPIYLFFYHCWYELNSIHSARPIPTVSEYATFHRDDERAWECANQRAFELAGSPANVTLGFIPAARALSELALALKNQTVQIHNVGTTDEAIRTSLMIDNVHTNSIGSYFVTLVATASIFGVSGGGSTFVPPEVNGITLSNNERTQLQNLALNIVADHQANYTTPTHEECRAEMIASCARWHRDDCTAFASAAFP